MKRSKFIKILSQGATIYSLLPVHKTFALTLDSDSLVKSDDWLRISGVYPHLAVFNQGNEGLCEMAGGECGIGALVSWAGKLWLITYSPHCPLGSADKLYSIDSKLNLTIHPESVGGTPANRMIHKPTNQLIIGPYFIDSKENIRVVLPEKMPGRLTAVAQHLSDPDNMVYFYDMEGKLYEANVHTLDTKLLFEKPIPGWHGKGGYTAQGRLILANNGNVGSKAIEEKPGNLQTGSIAQNEEQCGVLAEWNGKDWSIVRRRQFTEVTGPGGIFGADDQEAPAWSLGWDKRSVILMLLDNGEWTEFRLPKSTHTYDSANGYYTEWPRIRSVSNGKWLMDMHGMLYEIPQKFSLQHMGGIKSLCNHLLMITDFCEWKNEIVLSTDETSMMLNKLAGQSQSNLWFGSWNDLKSWGPPNGWGGVWQNDTVKAGLCSDPYLIGGFNKKIVHISHNASSKVTFTFEVYKQGRWGIYKNISVGPNTYEFYIFPDSFEGDWIKVKTDNDCEATVYFHYFSRGHNAAVDKNLFNGLATIEDKEYYAGLVRPAGYNTNLQYLTIKGNNKKAGKGTYFEVDEKMQFLTPANERIKEVEEICAIKKDFEVDEASVIVNDKSGSYRLPKTNSIYDRPFETGWPRGEREVITERSLLNVHGTFYEIALQSGISTIRPVCTHLKKIFDFCSWRGLLIMSGTSKSVSGGNYFSSKKGVPGLWVGNVDDLWKLGQPMGTGGPWKNTDVKANELSLPYLMTGYDKKKVELTSNKDTTISLEIDFDHNGWHLYKSFHVLAGTTVEYQFPDGYNAHWVRAKADKDIKATVQFVYS